MRQYIFYLPYETPSKKNSRVINRLTGRNFPNKRYTEWHNKAEYEIRRQIVDLRSNVHINTPCRISISFFHGDMRRRDSDNQASSILDLLKDCNILLDDDWQIVREIGIGNGYKKNSAGCLIKIEELKESEL